MEDSTWSRVEGMIIAHQLEPQVMIDYLVERAVVAQLDWFEETPQMMGIRVALDPEKHERVGTMPADSEEITPGPPLIDLVEDMAGAFKAEVMIGDMGIDRLSDTDDFPQIPDRAETGPLRIVEICDTPASAVPLIAAFEGVDIAGMGLVDGKRALMAVIPEGKVGWSFSDGPRVTLTTSDTEFQAFLIEDDDPEDIVTYNWGMVENVIPGAASGDAAMAIAHALVGSRQDILAIHNAVPGIDPEAAFASTLQRGPEAVDTFVASLGLPPSVAEFLRGDLAANQIEGATFHRARGVSNAIGRSVDIMLGEKGSDEASFWGMYTNMVSSRPYAVTMGVVAEAAVGALLLSASRGRGEKRSFGKKIGTFMGVALIVDSIAELSLAKYVTLRAERHAQRES